MEDRENLDDEFRNFLVERIEEWKVIPDKFQPDMKFSVSGWLGRSFQAE
ncbi:MAG: hypothetical protein AB9897_05875 [Anaerolineaceae bacterium]